MAINSPATSHDPILPTRSTNPYFSAARHFAIKPPFISSSATSVWHSVRDSTFSVCPTATPPNTAVTSAATGRTMAKAGPRRDHVAAILSTPVCGVATRNEVEAARDAPLRRMATAVGSTPHEHSGRGMPISADFTTAFQPVPERWRANTRLGMKACITPANRKPSRMYGDISLSI